MPPITANYTFYFVSDDAGDFYLSSNENPANLSYVCGAAFYHPTYWYNPVEQISSPRFLIAGQRYAIRARQEQGNGPDGLRMAVRIWNTAQLKTPAELKYQSLRERQIITFNTAVVREVQSITISGVSGGSFLVVGSGGVSASVDVKSTDLSKIQAAVASVTPSCSSIIATRRQVNTTIQYNITFNCPSFQDFTLLTVGNVNLNGSLNSIHFGVVRLVSRSYPLAGLFKFGFNNTWSHFVNISSIGSALAQELNNLPNFGAYTMVFAGNFLDSGAVTIEFQGLKVCQFVLKGAFC